MNQDRIDPKKVKASPVPALSPLVLSVTPAFPGNIDKPKEKEIPRFDREGLREVGLGLGDYRLITRANRENEGLRTPPMPPAGRNHSPKSS